MSRARLVLPLAVALIAALAVRAQTAGGDAPARAPVVSGIVILGNKTTKSDIILREMTLRAGDSVTTESVEYCQERLYSLGLFNRVTITYPPLDSTTLFVQVDERWYLYPVPLLGTVEHDITHWYYGLGVKHENFRGWNEKIFAGGVLGYNPWASLYYANPWIFGSEQLYVETTLSYQQTVNKSLLSRGNGANFNETSYGWSGLLGKRLDHYHSVWLEGGFTVMEAPSTHRGHTLSPTGIDRYITLGVGARHDTRNLREYATDGLYATAVLRAKGLGFGPVSFAQAVVDLRRFVPIGSRVAIAARGFATVSAGPSIPNYEHLFFGYAERIRGHFDEAREGENMAGASLEVRAAIVPPFYLHLSRVPVSEFSTWRLALYGAAFVDAGSVWNRHGRPGDDGVPHGAGLGLHLLGPYGGILRIDRAWNERGVGEWIIDLGAAF